jgi:hypothetical protein
MLILEAEKLKVARFGKLYSGLYDLKEMGVTGQHQVWLAGGALRSILDKNDVVCDFDLFFPNVETLEEVKRKLTDWGYKKVFQCPQGKLATFKLDDTKIQCISQAFYSDPGELIHTFDLSPGYGALDLLNGRLYLHEQFIRDVKQKKARLMNLTHPVATFNRIVKYKDKGYHVRPAIEEYVRRLNPTIDAEGMRWYID